MSLAECLLNKTPEEVIDIVKRSGLRGRAAAVSLQVRNGN